MKMMFDSKRNAILFTLILLAMVAGCSSIHGATGGASTSGQHRHGHRGMGAGAVATPPPVPTATVSVTTIHPTLTIAGVIAPYQNVAITTALNEFADTVSVNEGDRVHAGEVLAQFDTRDLRAQLASDVQNAASAQAKVSQTRYQATLAIGQGGDQVTSARSAVAQSRRTLADDQINLTRDRALLSQGYLANQAVDLQQTTVDNDRAAVRAAEANLASAQTNASVNGTSSQGLQVANIAAAQTSEQAAAATADQIRVQISNATITSPINGVIVNRNINPGEYPNGRTLFTVQEDARVYAELNASSSDVFKLRQSAPATVSTNGNSPVYHGTIAAVLGQVTPGSTNFTVKVLIPNADGRLPAGVPVTAQLTLPTPSGIGIPLGAFLDDSHTSVYVIRNGAAHIAHIRSVGDDGRTAIVTGLTAGDTIISNGQLDVTDGEKVALPKPAATPNDSDKF